jgi:hypothetical protein
MNTKIRKVVEEIERTKAKIAELQTLLPELERKKTMLENDEIIKLVRSVDVAPENLTDFVEAYKARSAGNAAVSGRLPQNPTPSAIRQEVSHNEAE